MSEVAAGNDGSALPPVRSRVHETSRHRTHYLECGPAGGPLLIFLHGWPSLSLMWRRHLQTFAGDGWRCVAPDLRGYGGSSVPAPVEAYAIGEIVADLAELHDQLGGSAAVWVGHDWGCAVAAALTAHEPGRSRAVVLTNLAYQPDGHALSTVVPLVDRDIYPADQYPDGQWDYYRYYTRHFGAAVAELDADIPASLRAVFVPGDPDAVGRVSPNAVVTRNGGRFGSDGRAPRTATHRSLWPAVDFPVLVSAFEHHGFAPSCAWYRNDDAALGYARSAVRQGRLDQPVLFVNGAFDQTCTVIGNRQGDPMRAACADLTEISMPAGHWLPLECTAAHISAIRSWMQGRGLAPDGAPRG